MCDIENYDFAKINGMKSSSMDKNLKQNDDTDSPTQDSGVQLLDSETDLNDSMISSSGLDFEVNDCNKVYNGGVTPAFSPDLVAPLVTKNALSKSDIENNNREKDIDLIETDEASSIAHPNLTKSTCHADMISSIHSTFDTENTGIVYRRKIRKQPKSAPKKRVSFHEDILNSTRTNDIHIEHGFITYKGRNQKSCTTRYSWCSEYNKEELDINDDDNEKSIGHRVYRNACSEVLDYGKNDIQDEVEKDIAKYETSCIFEYPLLNRKRFYRCTCSSSSSIESGSSNENNTNDNSTSSNCSSKNEKCSYKQAKSNSCDCIESSHNIEIGKGMCYFSEPNIIKSVWNKEKKPKNSCLKKSKRQEPTNVIQEKQSIESNLKKFNIHQLSSNVIKDNGKMIIGSLKDILGITLPERGVMLEEEAPEAWEEISSNLQSPKKHDDFSFLYKVGIFNSSTETSQKLSKSLDGGLGKQNKKFVHNVDEQLRRMNDEDLYASSNTNSRKSSLKTESSIEDKEADENLTLSCKNNHDNPQRNKFIINCESTVFEHTGTVELTSNDMSQEQIYSSFVSPLKNNPLKTKLGSIFQSFNGNAPNKFEADKRNDCSNSIQQEKEFQWNDDNASGAKKNNIMESSITSTSSIFSDVSCSTNTTASINQNYDVQFSATRKSKSPKHISSPMKKNNQTRMSPDLFNQDCHDSNLQITKNAKSIISNNFDDLLGDTSELNIAVDDGCNDIVIVDYADVKNDLENNLNSSSSYYLKLPSVMTSSTASTSSKTSLINRFLRNVTQKKILEATIKKNSFYQAKLKNESKLFGGNLYVKGVKPKNDKMIKDLNVEIDLEVEMGCNSLDYDNEHITCKNNRFSMRSASGETLNYDPGIGELKIDMFPKKKIPIFRDCSEVLMKAFKLYTGYGNEGNMCAVLVLLTDKTIYVTKLVRNMLYNKFVLPYAELDVILMGPMGNTVLLSNMARDMQQVLLTCGPYPAEQLIASLEICARRGGLKNELPAVGQLTLDHFAPLQAFVCNNSSVSKSDIWKYYSIVNIPAVILGNEEENEIPYGKILSGFFMHRSLAHTGIEQRWSAAYFMLKAGVLYSFYDSIQKIPNSAVNLHNECQGARRCATANRPHCFEIILRSGSLQLAAPDEYVCSEWLQAVIQSVNLSVNYDTNERPKILGCTLIMTENHLITLREDFSSPLKRVIFQQPKIMQSHFSSYNTHFLHTSKENIDPNMPRKLSNSTILDTLSEISSIRSTTSTPNRSWPSNSTICTTPTKKAKKICYDEIHNHTNMTSFYGKNSGIEILTCAAIEELISIKIPFNEDKWWCILEFSCQEVRENFDDLALFFSTNSEMKRFLSMLENLWHEKMDNAFPISISKENDFCPQQRHCEILFNELNHSWDTLLDAIINIKD